MKLLPATRLASSCVASACLASACLASSLFFCSTVAAQQPLGDDRRADALQPPATAEQFTTPNFSAPPVTPELWLYSQEQRRHDDPAQAVRRKAEIKAEQRMSRLAATKWFGLSTARPRVWAEPFVSMAPLPWPGATGYDRTYWSGAGSTYLPPYWNGYDVRR
jgi:hypothetical protein